MSESLQASAQKQLKQLVEQIERLEEDKKGIQNDIKEKYDFASSEGFDKKVLRQVVRIRKKSRVDRESQSAILETYLHALDML